MTPATSRWTTMAGDSLGLVAVVWAIPLGIILVGMPIVLLFFGARLVAQMIW